MWERLERREIRRRVKRPAGAEPMGARARVDLAPGTDMLPQIRHIVILMMENHSYDNYLGMLAGRGEGLPLGPDGMPQAVNFGPNGQAFNAHHLTSTVQTGGDPTQIASEALEMALAEMQDHLLSASPPDDEPLSLDAAMASVLCRSPSA